MKVVRYQKAFSLIEVIAVMLMVSVIGGILYLYFVSAYAESYKPLSEVQRYYDLHNIMENIIADYSINHPEWQKLQPRWQKLTYYPVSVMVRSDGNKGYIYQCIVAGKSGNTAPLGFASGASPITDGTLTWTRMPDLNELKNKINTMPMPNEYGTYIVQENKFIKFTLISTDTYQDQEISAGEPETILKVTISNDSGTSLTNLFTNVN